MNIIQKAQAGVKLTPSEHAIFQTLLSLFLTALSTGCLVAGGLILAPGMIDWQNLTIVVISSIVFSFVHGMAKYVSTSNPVLGAAIDTVVTDMEKRAPLPLPLQGIQPVAMPRVRNPASMDTLPNMPIVQPRPPTQQL